MDDQVRLACEFAGSLSKDLITLTAGILALSVAFAKDIIKKPTRSLLLMIAASWSFYLLSIICGIWALMALTGSIASTNSAQEILDHASPAAQAQILVFGVATLLFTIAGVLALLRYRGEADTPNTGATPDANRASHGRRR